MQVLAGTQIEVIHDHMERGNIRHALFDFDGTISLIREGWQQVMIPMMVDILQELHTDETRDDLTATVTEFVERLTGKQTIYQMIELCDEIRKRGGTPQDPLEYKYRYLDLLWERIKDRVAALKAGRAQPDDMMVPGAREMLEALRARGVRCYLASGTDEKYVFDEAGALGVTPYFQGIYGAIDDYQNYSKKMVIERIIRENELKGSELAAFGDGYVEIENAQAVGGIAIGVASNEATRCGIDSWKRARLIQAGADLIIPDFREWQPLVAYLLVEG